MEDIITEKFALLNLIKAIQSISSPNSNQTESASEAAPPPTPPVAGVSEEKYNAMASVLTRHEAISNRVKNSK